MGEVPPYKATRSRPSLKDLEVLVGEVFPSPIHPYRGTSLIRNRTALGPYKGTMPRALQWP